MEYIIILIACIVLIIVGYFLFHIQIKKMKEAGENKYLDDLINRFPENKEIAKEILTMLNNEKVKIKENENSDSKTSLYIAISNTIFIANIKNSYTRIQTISHECLHSIQSKRLLIFNFIYSNIYFAYFLLSIILTITGIEKEVKLQIIFLSILGFFYYVIRSYLEMDAMIKAKYVAEKYMLNYIKTNPICTKQEVEKVIEEYDRINQLGIPATNYILFFNCILKLILYILVVLISKLF